MLCRSYRKIGFGIFLLVFAWLLFFSFFLDTPSTYALSDLSVSYQAGDSLPAATLYFPFCDETCYSQYNYIIFDFSNPSVDFLPNSTFSIRGLSKYNGSTRNLNYTSEYSTIILSLNSVKSLFGFMSNPNNSITLLTDLTVTLTESLSPNAPSGSITLTENGTFDVSSYATAIVDVPPTVVQGDYHDDLVSIKNAIYVGAAVLLVLYFFYCIYRMIIKSTGGH